MKKLLLLIVIIAVGFGAWKYFGSKDHKYADLNYKTMDERGIYYHSIEYPYELCIKDHESDPRYQHYCACYGNSMIDALTNEEFGEIDKALLTQGDFPAEVDAKIKQISISCRNAFPLR